MMVKEIVKEISDLCLMQKARNIKSDNVNDDDGKVMLINIHKIFKASCYMCEKKEHKKESCHQQTRKTEDNKKIQG